MPFDAMPQGSPWGEPWAPVCKSCQRPIGRAEPAEEVRFAPDPVHRLEEMSGTYHAACAQPYLSISRALDMLGRAWS